MKKSEKMSVEVVQLTTKNISDQQQNAQQQNMGNKNNDGDELADLRNLQNKSRKTSAAVKTGDQPVINNATISENKDFELNARILMSSRHQASGKIRTQGMDVLSRNVEQGQSKIESSDLGMKMKGGIGQSLERQSIFTENRPQAANRMPNMSPVEQTAETIRKSGKTSRLVLNLNPKDLGQVKLDLTVTGDRLQASFRADTTQAKESLQMNMHVLKEALAEKGFDVEKMDFNFSSREESFGESDQQKNEGQGSQGDKQQSKGQFGTNAMGEDIGNIDESDSEDLLAEAEAIAAEAVAEMSDRRVNIQA
jgi:flagellar hook-length control protein FliK